MTVAVQTATIRLATHGDVPRLCELLEALKRETFWGSLPVELDGAFMSQHLHETLVFHPQRRVLVLDEGRGPSPEVAQGIAYGEIVSHPLIPHWPHLIEWALYVEPSARGQGHGARLWSELKAWARTRGAKGAVYGKTLSIGPHKKREVMIWESFDA